MTSRPDDAVTTTQRRRALVVVAAGSGTRLGFGTPKAAVSLGGRTILDQALEAVTVGLGLDLVVLVLPEDPDAHRQLIPAASIVAARARAQVIVVNGGSSRPESVAAGSAAVVEHTQLAGWDPDTVKVLIHDAARALTPGAVFDRVLTALDSGAEAVVPTVEVADTIKRVDAAGRVQETLARSELRAVQTPQGFTLRLLQRAAEYVSENPERASALTDEAMIAEHLGAEVTTVAGDAWSLKITTPTDLTTAAALLGPQSERVCQNHGNTGESGGGSRSSDTPAEGPADPAQGTATSADNTALASAFAPASAASTAPASATSTGPAAAPAPAVPAPAPTPRVGIGQDIHAFAPQHEPTPLWLAGLHWPGEQGLAGHSDGDAAAHACCDALFSAAGLGDLGVHFGTDRPELAGASGTTLLREAAQIVRRAGFAIGSLSVQFIGSRPKFGPRREEAHRVLSEAAGAPVAVSATTSDGLGFTGRGEGISATATAVLIPPH